MLPKVLPYDGGNHPPDEHDGVGGVEWKYTRWQARHGFGKREKRAQEGGWLACGKSFSVFLCLATDRIGLKREGCGTLEQRTECGGRKM
ncbi:peptide chain release factor 2 [Anopheles sinensis]|uniref:Peptide chain release factor 2 n=1 Tax=Anopheles sinensis TaxID=74873 RepID=A0A084VN66_ANOSI|nr:peptide chain release factor 2 [Anopheles sinensis]